MSTIHAGGIAQKWQSMDNKPLSAILKSVLFSKYVYQRGCLFRVLR